MGRRGRESRGGGAGEPGAWRHVVRVLRTPIATLVFALLLYGAMRYDSGTGFTQYPPGGPVLASGAPDPCLMNVVRTPQGLRLSPVDMGEAHGRITGNVHYAYRRRSQEMMATAVLRESQGVVIGGILSPAEFDAVQAMYVEHLRSHAHPFWRRVGSELKGAGTSGSVTKSGRWIVLVHFVLWAGLAHSLWWVPRAYARVVGLAERVFQPPLTPQEKRWRSLARGECPSCAYSIHGLAGTQCPECGERWHAMEMTAWDRRGRG